MGSGLFRHSISALAVAVALACGHASAPPPAVRIPGAGNSEPLQPSVIRAAAGPVTEVRVEAYCSLTTPRVGLARLTWPEDRIEPERRRIEVTVYKDGFENGLFAASPFAARQRFKTASPVSETDKPRAFDLEVDVVERTQRPDTVSVVVKRLEPGLVYRFRIPVREGAEWVASQTLRVDAPTCPTDHVR